MNIEPIVKDILKEKNKLDKKLKDLDSSYLSLRKFWGYFGKSGNINKQVSSLFIVGGRGYGKTFQVQQLLLNIYERKDREKNEIFYIRLNEKALKKAMDKGFLDPILKRRYKKEVDTYKNGLYFVKRQKIKKVDKDGNEYEEEVVTKDLFCTCYAASTFYNEKGTQIFDPNKENYYVFIDEIEEEKGVRKVGDSAYSIVSLIETLLRDAPPEKVHVIACFNALSDGSEVLAKMCNFIPEDYGIFRRNGCLIVNLKNSPQYEARVKRNIARRMSQGFTNTNYDGIQSIVDTALICKERLVKPSYIICFSDKKEDWFTMWQSTHHSNIIARYKGETCNVKISMKPFITGLIFNNDLRDTIINLWDIRSLLFTNQLTWVRFKLAVKDVKPRGVNK